MRFILYSEIGESTIRDRLGQPQYSYYFVLKRYRHVLEKFGKTTIVSDPLVEVDSIYDLCRAAGEDCLFLSFSPPNFTPVVRCPTATVLAWEFDTLPDKPWNGDPRNDWRNVFARDTVALTLSTFSADVVRQAMGDDFNVEAIAAPIWDSLGELRGRADRLPWREDMVLRLSGQIFDTRLLKLDIDEPITLELPATAPPPPAPPTEVPADPPSSPAPSPVHRRGLRFRLAVTKRLTLEWYREVVRDLLPAPIVEVNARLARSAGSLIRVLIGPGVRPKAASIVREDCLPELEAAPINDIAPDPPEPEGPKAQTRLSGVIYTSVFGPSDGRKNWYDILTAFCWAFRETEDATLVLKFVHGELWQYHNHLMLLLAQLAPFKCRVVALHGYMEDDEYQDLIAATSYYVNASSCEGLCLPLMEYMAARRPAIAPRHTAMLDYIDERAAFIVRSTPETNVWPNDPEHLFRTYRQRIEWDSLVDCYRRSYVLAKERPDAYCAMGDCAEGNVRAWSSEEVVTAKLHAFLNRRLSVAGETRKLEESIS